MEVADRFLCRETTWVILIFNYLKSDYGKGLLIPCVFEVHGHLWVKPWTQSEGVFATCALVGGNKALVEGVGEGGDVAVSAEMGFYQIKRRMWGWALS